MQFYGLILGVLGTWRVAHLLSAEDGPANIFVRLRKYAGRGFWGTLLDCFYCLSLWVSVPFSIALGETFKEQCLLWLALSGGAITLERISSRGTVPPAIYFEDGEEDDALLRKEQDGGQEWRSGR